MSEPRKRKARAGRYGTELSRLKLESTVRSLVGDYREASRCLAIVIRISVT